jgi:hypothetical protein
MNSSDGASPAPVRELDSGTFARKAAGFRRRCLWASCCLLLLAGCATQRPTVHQALKLDMSASVSDGYTVRCPDVLEVRVAGRPDLSGERAIGADGRIQVTPASEARVEGLPASECAARLAAALGVSLDRVSVRVAEFRSQQIYLVGPETGMQEAVPYRGPETVLGFLERMDHLSGANPQTEVRVVRSQSAGGGAPEVFRISLRQQPTEKDPGSSLRLQPFDYVYLKQTARDQLWDLVPIRLRSLLERAAPNQTTQAGKTGDVASSKSER